MCRHKTCTDQVHCRFPGHILLHNFHHIIAHYKLHCMDQGQRCMFCVLAAAAIRWSRATFIVALAYWSSKGDFTGSSPISVLICILNHKQHNMDPNLLSIFLLSHCLVMNLYLYLSTEIKSN